MGPLVQYERNSQGYGGQGGGARECNRKCHSGKSIRTGRRNPDFVPPASRPAKLDSQIAGEDASGTRTASNREIGAPGARLKASGPSMRGIGAALRQARDMPELQKPGVSQTRPYHGRGGDYGFCSTGVPAGGLGSQLRQH